MKTFFVTNSYNTQESRNVPIIMNGLGLEGLRLVQTLNDKEQEKYRTGMEFFQGLSEKFKPQHNETILQLQYCKLIKEKNVNADE